MSVAVGFTLPVPACSTSEARPDKVLSASAGGLATLSGAGSGAKAGGFCWATAVAPSTVTTARADRNVFIRLLSFALAAGVEAAVADRAVNTEKLPVELRRSQRESNHAELADAFF